MPGSPVRQVWPRISGRARAGDPLFPGMNANNFNRLLKQTTVARNFDRGGFSPPCLPHGRDSQTKKLGLCHSRDFKIRYLALSDHPTLP